MSDFSKPSMPERRFPSYRQIQIIEAIAAFQGVGQAADALHLSQPAVTRALQQAEDVLGVRLFDRTSNGVKATVFVEPILKRAQFIHAAIKETERDLKQLKHPELNRLRIGAGIHGTEIWVNRAIASLVLSNSNYELSVQAFDWNDMITALLADEIDYCIGEIGDIDNRPDLAIEHLANLPLHFICRAQHPLAHKENPCIDEISRFPMVGNKLTRRLSVPFRDRIGRLGRVDPESGGIFAAIRVTNLKAIQHVLIGSDAVALMPVDSIRDELNAGSLVAIQRTHMPWLVGNIGFIAPKSRTLTPLGKAFRSAILNIEAKRRQSEV